MPCHALGLGHVGFVCLLPCHLPQHWGRRGEGQCLLPICIWRGSALRQRETLAAPPTHRAFLFAKILKLGVLLLTALR